MTWGQMVLEWASPHDIDGAGARPHLDGVASGRGRPKVDEWLVLLVTDGFTAAAIGAVGGGRAGAVVGTACLLLTLALAGLYRPRLILSALDDLARVGLAVGLAWMLTAWLAPAVPSPGVLPPATSWGWWGAIAGGLALSRAAVTILLKRRRRRAGGETTVIIGVGLVAERLARALRSHPEFGLRPVGFVGSPAGIRGQRLPLPLLGPVEKACEVATRLSASHLVVAFPNSPDADLVAALRECRRHGREVMVVPRLFEMNVSRLRAEVVDGIPLVRMPTPAVRRLTWRVKRLLDILLATLCLLVLSPVVAACALAVRWETGRVGVIFRQERIGDHGSRFHILKFRSLTPSSELESRAHWNVADDSRVGRVGRVIRRTSLDELPQLVNVLRGEMSLVGPRPERPYFVDSFGRVHRHYLHRLRVPAGMTGWAQIHGLRGDTSIDDRASYDNYYIENWSLGLDLKIMIRTAAALALHSRTGKTGRHSAPARQAGEAR